MDGNNQQYGCGNMGCGFVVLLIAAVCGWLVYGSFTAGFWVAVLCLALALTALIGLIPIVGPFIYWQFATTAVLPTLMASSGLTDSWLTTAVLWLYLGLAIFWTIVATLAALAGMFGEQKYA
jgi:hypothetical protein